MVKTIALSVEQKRIPKTGSITVSYIAFNEGLFCGLYLCTKSKLNELVKNEVIDYPKNYIEVKITRPEIMWGTNEEIRRDILDIVCEEMEGMGWVKYYDGECWIDEKTVFASDKQ